MLRAFSQKNSIFQADINASVILNFGQAIRDNQFTASQIEIDDNWESCYGDATFNEGKFGDPATLVDELKGRLGLRVTLWIHPFINLECSSWMYAAVPPQSYLVRDTKGKSEDGSVTSDPKDPDIQ